MKKGKRKSILAKLLSCVMVLQVAASFGASSYAAESESGTSVTPIFNPDYAQLIGRSDISYTGQISNGMQGFSVANGRFGGPVWQSTDSTLTMQVNHTSVFMFNDASSVSKDHLNSGGAGIGRIHVNVVGSVFGGDTENYISLY